MTSRTAKSTPEWRCSLPLFVLTHATTRTTTSNVWGVGAYPYQSGWTTTGGYTRYPGCRKGWWVGRHRVAGRMGIGVPDEGRRMEWSGELLAVELISQSHWFDLSHWRMRGLVRCVRKHSRDEQRREEQNASHSERTTVISKGCSGTKNGGSSGVRIQLGRK